MSRKKELIVNFLVGTICGLFLIASFLTLFTIYWESKGFGSLTIGRGIFTTFKLLSRIPGKEYIVSIHPGVIWYTILFGVGNVLASEGARFLIGKV